MGLLNLGSLAGLIALALLAWALGGFRRSLPWKTVAGTVALMLVVGLMIFTVPASRDALLWLNGAVISALDAGNEGARFLFGPLALNPGELTDQGEGSIGFVLVAQVLPALVFFSALMALLYHLNVIQPVIGVFARIFYRLLGLSGAESLAGSSNLFVGVESAMTVRPFLDRMTRSELLTLMTCGMSTVASTTLAFYVLLLNEIFPLVAGHLISASVISIPAAVLTSKLLLPESEQPVTRGHVPSVIETDRQPYALAAVSTGAWDGLRMAAGIATMLIAILGMVALVDLLLAWMSAPFSDLLGGTLSLGRILGWLFTPLVWLLGIAGGDLQQAARILGERIILTEVVSYRHLAELAAAGSISPRTLLVLSYALCGFAHVASVGIFVGGIAALAPSRRGELAALGPRALLAATLATLMTGAIAGMFYHGQTSILGL